MSFLLNLFGSKKLVAAISGLLAIPAVMALAKLGLKADVVEVASAIGGVVTVVLAYIVAQYRIDINTNGDTTTAKMLERVATGQNGAVPASVVAALKVAAVLIPAGPGRDAVNAALAELGVE